MTNDRLLHWVLQPKFIEQPNNYIKNFYTLHFPPKQSYKTWDELINTRDQIEISFKERGFDQQLWEGTLYPLISGLILILIFKNLAFSP
jgi:hypothetical protein